MNIEQQRDLLAAALDRAMGMIRSYGGPFHPNCNWVINLCNQALNTVEPQHLHELREGMRFKEEHEMRYMCIYMQYKELSR